MKILDLIFEYWGKILCATIEVEEEEETACLNQVSVGSNAELYKIISITQMPSIF